MHKGKGEDQGSRKAHNVHREEDNCLKTPEILEEGSGKVREEIRIYLSTVKSKEDGKEDCRYKTYCDPCGKAFSIRKIITQLQLVVFNGLVDAKASNDPVEQAVEDIGV